MTFRTAYGYTVSENGWRMCDRNECGIVNIPGLTLVDTAPLRKGAPLTILGAWLRWYDQNVDEIVSPVWGWSATNDVANSNHLAGTAVDINAPKYPWGARTMPADRKGRIRAGLALFEGTVFWGADWNRADEMHFQLAFPDGDKRNDAFAAKLMSGYLGIYKPAPAPAPKPEAPLMALTDAEQHELLDGVRFIRDQIGPGFDAWGEDGDLGCNAAGQRRTLRAGMAAIRRKLGS